MWTDDRKLNVTDRVKGNGKNKPKYLIAQCWNKGEVVTESSREHYWQKKKKCVHAVNREQSYIYYRTYQKKTK
jgi:hypothetical protein